MNNPRYPFNFINAFIKSAHFERKESLPETLEVKLKIDTKVLDDIEQPDKFQVLLRVGTETEREFSFSVEVIGFFDCIESKVSCDPDIRLNFLKNRGLFILFTYVKSYVHSMTSQMGMSPLNLSMPVEFQFETKEDNRVEID
jgi:preprotein translocase subunit SecB